MGRPQIVQPTVGMRSTQAGRAPLRTLVLVAWAVCIGLLLRFEAFPEFFSHKLEGYRSLLKADVIVRDDWMRIVHESGPIGYSHTTVETYESDPLRYYTVINKVFMRLRLMGSDQPIFIDTVAHIDVAHRLQSFRFSFSSKAHSVEVDAKRVDESNFEVSIDTGAFRQKSRVEIPDDVILYSPMTEMAMKNLRRGQSLSIKTIDPATLSPSVLSVRSMGMEKIEFNGQAYQANRLVTSFQGTEIESYIGVDGRLLRQETAFGWVMEACTADEAMGVLADRSTSGDFISDLAVPVDRPIANPRQSRRLVIRLRGVPFTVEELTRPRQSVIDTVDGEHVLEVLRSRLGGAAAPLSTQARELYMASTTFIQSSHEAIIEKAERIVKSAVNDQDKAARIYNWVHENVKKEISVSLPSALDVLQQLRGDCNEHTYLMVALARAAGLPSKVMVGLAYHEGGFYYHAWPAVHVGEWIEMDPTWGQEYVDATHIALTEGELENQFTLFKVLGRLSVEVRDVQ